MHQLSLFSSHELQSTSCRYSAAMKQRQLPLFNSLPHSIGLGKAAVFSLPKAFDVAVSFVRLSGEGDRCKQYP